MTPAETREAGTDKLPAPPPPKGKGHRLPFLDWSRGLGATIMLQGHVFHSFLRKDLRDQGPYVISQFVGGLAPAIFLFLTGVTLAFLLDGLQKKGIPEDLRVKAALKRAAYLAALAIAFRVQLWLFGLPYSQWSDLLKVDILNCMALAILSLSWVAFLKTRQRVHAGLVSGVLIACASPLVSLLPADMPRLLKMYFVPSNDYFAYFPWASFIAFGLGAGSVLRQVHTDQIMHRVMQWASIIGFGLIMSGQYFSSLPYSLYPKSDFWLNSPGLIFIKLGVIFLLLAFTFLWTHHGSRSNWSWVRQLGTTSLLVYWVHIELVYGRWFGAWKESLTVPQCAVASLVLIICMVALSRASTHWHWPVFRLGTVAPLRLNRASGD